jgi:RsiW-degrading membrane proteinase PrsW (M82 family)
MSRLGFGLSILPVFLIGLYIYKKDRNKEPVGILIKLFIGGILSVFIVLAISDVVFWLFPSLQYENFGNSTYVSLFFKVFFGIAIIEEFSKWLIVYKISYNSIYFDEYYDIILYSVFVALGFAGFENIIYVFQMGFTTGVLRFFTAVPAHCFFGILMGELLGLAKIYETKGIRFLRKENLILSIIIPALTHCIYDYLAMLGNIYSLVAFVVVIIFGYITSIKRIRKLSNMK